MTGASADALGFIRLTEVGPRDGLQNEKRLVSTAAKVEFVDLLSAAGFPEIEVSSFVSPKWVPQLGDAADVFARIQRRPGTVYSALVPNERGMDAALAARVDKVAIFAAASEGFSAANTGGTIAEVVARFVPVVRAAHAARIPVRAYVSCVVRCPYDGAVAPSAVRRVVEQLLALGADEIDLEKRLALPSPKTLSACMQSLPVSCRRRAQHSICTTPMVVRWTMRGWRCSLVFVALMRAPVDLVVVRTRPARAAMWTPPRC